MPEIKHALVTVYAGSENLEKIKNALAPAEVTYCNIMEKDKIAQAAKIADVCILNGDLNDDILAGENIKWIHCCHAGVEKSACPELFERGIILTTSSGRSAPALAEHALMFMLALTYDLPMLMRNQKAHIWRPTMEYYRRTGMYTKTVGILGLGKTGREVARLCKGFDMKVLGWRRGVECPENVDEVYSSDRDDNIHEMLSRCDYVVLCCELNDSTWHIINETALKAMKPTAYLINMGRGGLVDEPKLIEALKDGTIAGAGLDTVSKEPLPQDNELWDLPNVIITPHVTPQLPDREDRMIGYALHNIKAYREGGEFVNQVTEKSILTKNKG